MKPRQCKCGGDLPWYARVCQRCSASRHLHSRFLSGAAFCHKEVAKARGAGQLPDPRTLRCSDCNGMATEYDHRDYNFPLLVTAVCRGCNARRGKAAPRMWADGEWDAYISAAWQANRGGKKWAPQIVRLLEAVGATFPSRPDLYA